MITSGMLLLSCDELDTFFNKLMILFTEAVDQTTVLHLFTEMKDYLNPSYFIYLTCACSVHVVLKCVAQVVFLITYDNKVKHYLRSVKLSTMHRFNVKQRLAQTFTVLLYAPMEQRIRE